MRTLLISDDVKLRGVLKDVIAQTAILVSVYSAGTDPLDILSSIRKNQPQILVVDADFLGAQAFRLFRTVRMMYQQIEIILIASDTEALPLQELNQLAIQHVLLKPVTSGAIKNLITALKATREDSSH